MNIGDIVITILVIINIVAFASAIWVSCDKWKKGIKEWQTPLMGLFFIPLCVFLALVWPYIKYREHREKKKMEAEKALREKQWEESKKYHFQRFAFRLKDLPFKPTSCEIIYVENEYNDKLDSLIRRNLGFIQECLNKSQYFKSKFVYLPYLIKEISLEEQAIGYIAPYLKEKSPSSSITIKSSTLLDFMLVPENRKNITPCFARYQGEDSKGSLFECVGFNPEDDIDEKDFIKSLCSTFDHYPQPTGPAYQTAKEKRKENAGADESFDKESKQLIKEVEERILQLRKLGVSQWALEQLVKPELKLSKLVVTKDFHIILPDYNNIEIKMEPLVKAIYFLFLKHPEGIPFKCLPDYREELTKIYIKLKPYGMSDRVIQSIEDVTNPLLNSINEKCARIRSGFVEQFDDRIATHYYINGLRGEPKKIDLPRNLVVWE